MQLDGSDDREEQADESSKANEAENSVEEETDARQNGVDAKLKPVESNDLELRSRRRNTSSPLQSPPVYPPVANPPSPTDPSLAKSADIQLPSQPTDSLTDPSRTENVPSPSPIRDEAQDKNKILENAIDPDADNPIDPVETANTNADAETETETDTSSIFASLHLLDSILCIAGERYGQRDLLASRERIWAGFGGGG